VSTLAHYHVAMHTNNGIVLGEATCAHPCSNLSFSAAHGRLTPFTAPVVTVHNVGDLLPW
jgi:hypothetical protein